MSKLKEELGQRGELVDIRSLWRADITPEMREIAQAYGFTTDEEIREVYRDGLEFEKREVAGK
jgi:hypothetical protein